ncbi:hypothetical protein F8M41_008981 [Gigaspora margarita]|uniref:Uncharacterized protein n=1 Tax=Gigaspora margarita TaxID=4874 RepID=A0A8H3X498_GIGMA|nr:hypothetical protein F8M41_008981 [Gigaspora margarita]
MVLRSYGNSPTKNFTPPVTFIQCNPLGLGDDDFLHSQNFAERSWNRLIKIDFWPDLGSLLIIEEVKSDNDNDSSDSEEEMPDESDSYNDEEDVDDANIFSDSTNKIISLVLMMMN